MSHGQQPGAKVRFEAPPVRMAMLMLWFQPISELQTLDLASLRSKWRENLPQIQEMSAFPGWMEDSEDVTFVGEDDRWPMPACLFLNFEGDREILVQNDRLVLTWRFEEQQQYYPGFIELFAQLRDAYADFVASIEEVGFEQPSIRRVSIRYVNTISDVDHQDAAEALLLDRQIEQSDAARDVNSLRVTKHYCPTEENKQTTQRVTIAEGATATDGDHGHGSRLTSMILDGESDVPPELDPYDRLVDVHDAAIDRFTSLIGPELRKAWGEHDGN